MRTDEQIKALREALEWYGEQARLARLIYSEGDSGRNALASDGGKRACNALALTTPDADGGDGWRSIESAPADETVVLLAWWDGLSESWRYSARPYSNLDIARQGQGYTDGWATHWRPLPPPPAREGGKERWVAISTY